MRRTSTAIVVVLVIALGGATVAIADIATQTGPAEFALLPAPTVYVTPDHFAQLPIYWITCASSVDCGLSMALFRTARSAQDEPAHSITTGAQLSDALPVALLPTSRDTAFPAIRLVPAAWRALIADGALATTLVARLPSHQRQILAYVSCGRRSRASARGASRVPATRSAEMPSATPDNWRGSRTASVDPYRTSDPRTGEHRCSRPGLVRTSKEVRAAAAVAPPASA